LLEVNNVYDPAISFEAIHRVVFNVDSSDFISALKENLTQGSAANYPVRWTANSQSGEINVAADCIGDAIEAIQAFIDDYSKRNNCEIDYIHGEDSVKKLASLENCVGIILPAMDKSDLFATVKSKGVFPRKSFSVGHARDKRYYLECRSIK